MRLIILPGDGIGREVSAQVSKVVQCLEDRFHLEIETREIPCGGRYFLETGLEWPEGSFELCRDWADAVFLGAVGWPGALLESGDPAGRNVLFGLRFGLDLYANVRPVKLLPGVGQRLQGRMTRTWSAGDVDFVIFRENTEGLYAGVGGMLTRSGRSELAVDSRVTTRKGAERIIRAAFREALRRSDAPRVTCVDKSNVLDGCRLFREVFHETAESYPGVETDCRYIDAFCQALLCEPASFDVVVTSNLFGDIASDVAAVLAGGLGTAPSAEMSDTHALFEPVHGSAPGIAGTGEANPVGALLSAAMMLEWYGRGKGGVEFIEAGTMLTKAVVHVLSVQKLLPRDLGGDADCDQIGDSICRRLLEIDVIDGDVSG